MAKIQCKKCNQRLKSMIEANHHVCPKEYIKPNWSKSVGKNSKAVAELKRREYLKLKILKGGKTQWKIKH